MSLLSWPSRRWVAAAFGAVVFALAAGVPTDVVPTPLFTRMTPVPWWNYYSGAMNSAWCPLPSGGTL